MVILDRQMICVRMQVATSLTDLSSASIATCQEFEVEELTPAVPQVPLQCLSPLSKLILHVELDVQLIVVKISVSSCNF